MALKDLPKKQVAAPQSKYTESFVPIKSIANGMIVLDNNVKVTGLKIQPKNIFILDSFSQEAIITNLRNVYNVINFEFWLIVAGRPVDINVYLSQLQLLYQNESNLAIRKLINQDIQKGNQFMQNNVVDTEYYIMFKEKNVELMQKKENETEGAYTKIITILKNLFAQLSIQLDNYIIEDLLYNVPNELYEGTYNEQIFKIINYIKIKNKLEFENLVSNNNGYINGFYQTNILTINQAFQKLSNNLK